MEARRKTFLTAPSSTLRNYTYAYDPPLTIQRDTRTGSTSDGQVIEQLDLLVANGPFTLNHRVTMRDCRIRFAGTGGLLINSGAAGSEIRNVQVEYLTTPVDFDSLPSTAYCIALNSADGIQLEDILVIGGVNGVRLFNSHNVALRNITGRNQYNTADHAYGQFIRANQCRELTVFNFHSQNDPDASFTSDLIWLGNCHGAFVTDGVLDGNNDPNGSGILIAGSSGCNIQRVDAIHMSMYGFSIDSGVGNTLLRCRVRDNNGIGTGGRAAPADGGYAFNSEGQFTNFHRCQYFDLYDADNVIHNDDQVTVADFTEHDFDTRPAHNTAFRWQKGLVGPVTLALIGMDGVSPVLITTMAPAVGTDIGKLTATSNYTTDVFTYTLVADPDAKFQITGNVLETKGTFNYNNAQFHLITVRVTDQRGNYIESQFSIPVDPGAVAPVTIVAVDLEEI